MAPRRRGSADARPQRRPSLLDPRAPSPLVVVAVGDRQHLGDRRHQVGLGDRRRRDGAGELSDCAVRCCRRASASITNSRSIRRNSSARSPGASGSPFLAGNTVELLNNGDAFYPPMLEAIETARSLDHHRGLHLLGRGDRAGSSPTRSPERAQAGHQGQDPARRDRLGEHRRRDPRHPRRQAGARSPGTTRSAGTRSDGSTTARTASR